MKRVYISAKKVHSVRSIPLKKNMESYFIEYLMNQEKGRWSVWHG